MKRRIIILISILFIWTIAVLTLSESSLKNDNPESSVETLDSETANFCSGSALCVTDEVTYVVDGDTIYTKNYRIRLSLTNTPEINQAGFSEATAFTQSLCPVGSMVSIDQDDGQRTDVYGRMLAKVTCSGKNLNAELLENNHGYILDRYCAESEFASESWAKKFGC